MQDKKALKRISPLVAVARCDPFAGTDKPELLLGSLTGLCSRNIDETQRMIYAVDDTDFGVIACCGHCDDSTSCNSMQ